MKDSVTNNVLSEHPDLLHHPGTNMGGTGLFLLEMNNKPCCVEPGEAV